MDLREYLQSNTAATKNFFYQNVRRITGKDPRISRGEKVYVAGFLTMYAELSSIRPTLPHFSNASEIKEFFAALSNTTGKPEYWEAGGEQTLFVNGFFQSDPHPGNLFFGNFPLWTETCWGLHLSLQNNRYAINKGQAN